MKSVLIASMVLFVSFFHIHGANAEWLITNPANGIYGYDFYDEMNGLAIVSGNNTVKRTTDGGMTWENIANLDYPDSTGSPSRIYFDHQNAYVEYSGYTNIYSDENNDVLKLYTSTDFGETWAEMKLPESPIEYNVYSDILFDSKGNIFIEYYEGGPHPIAVLFNGEDTWSFFNVTHSPIINEFEFIDKTTGYYAFGNSIFKTTDGGETWNKIYVFNSTGFYKIKALSADFVWVYGGETLLYTKDGGKTWKENGIKPYVLTRYFSNCFPLDENRALVTVKYKGDLQLYLFDMLNDTRSKLETPAEFTRYGYESSSRVLAELSGNRLYVGNFYVLTDVQEKIDNAVAVETETPVPFALNPAYPNPFNPSTTISFSIPETSYVKLSVYNITGQKVATLSDKEMSAGYYSVVWNAYGMSSGTYFYSLESMGKKQTGKMLLLK